MSMGGKGPLKPEKYVTCFGITSRVLVTSEGCYTLSGDSEVTGLNPGHIPGVNLGRLHARQPIYLTLTTLAPLINFLWGTPSRISKTNPIVILVWFLILS